MHDHQNQEWPAWMHVCLRLLCGIVAANFFWFTGRGGNKTMAICGLVIGLALGLAYGTQALCAIMSACRWYNSPH